jgi:hypothetical protein
VPKGSHPADPRGLIHEAFAMDLAPEDARTIFLDWALGPEAADPAATASLLARYAPAAPDHPMATLLREAAAGTPSAPARRGGARGRRPPAR